MKTPYLGLITVVLGLCATSGHTARILAFFPSISYSNLILHAAAAEALAEAGHNVTVFSNHPNPSPRATYNYIHLEYQLQNNVHQLINKTEPAMKRHLTVMNDRVQCSNHTLNHPKMREFLRDHRAGDFDVVLVNYLLNDFLFGLGAHFRCPIVLTVTSCPVCVTRRFLGNPSLMSHESEIGQMWEESTSIRQRLRNVINNVKIRLFLNHYVNDINYLYRFAYPSITRLRCVWPESVFFLCCGGYLLADLFL